MDLTVYLPDEIGARAKEAEVNFSRLLRDAVEDELERRATVQKTLDKTETYELELLDDDDRRYTGRITGKLIAEDEDRETWVYLTEDERVILCSASKYWVLDEDLEEVLQEELDPVTYTEAMAALGLKAVIDL